MKEKVSEKLQDYDDFLDEYTGFSRYQMLLCAGAFFLTFSTSATQQIAIFLSATPEHRCSIPVLDNQNCNLTENEIKNLTIPQSGKKYDSCSQYDVNLTTCNGVPVTDSNTSIIPCSDGYHYDYEVYGETTITQWNLVCDRSILDVIATSIFFAGWLLGSWSFGPFSDWYGRKLPLLVYCLIFAAIGITTTFIPIFEVYVFLRFLSGAATIASYIAVFTYVNEISPKKHQLWISFACVQVGNTAVTVLPGFAYALRDWRHLQLLCSAMALGFVPIYFFLQESPRWLMAVGREDEAKKIVMKFVKSNKKTFNDKEWNIAVETEKRKVEAKKSSKKYTLVDLFRLPRMRLVTLAVMFNWFTVSLVFYGLALNVGNLSGDPYINSAINAGVGYVGNCLLLLVPFVGKRILLASAFLICGIFCIASTVCIEVANGNEALSTTGVALAIMGKAGMNGAFSMAYMATSAIFPTVIRGTGMSVGSMSARIGSIITPFTIEAQKEIPWLTQTIFGCLSLLAFFSAIVLPETKSAIALTSIEEAEEYYENNMSIVNKFAGKKKIKNDDLESTKL